ncbi:hypothetical protein DFH08DRAFT_806279 [Mycena albidolilacea]|uniref:Uncharacterized protein n=1 Tax=Mycena albidolilacea TaxID=1033008 RepID=A0AAD7EUD2_9AGAR|nr:hypothetical protein DFH08DRAFT_806279 [Mycena albidolilacea]
MRRPHLVTSSDAAYDAYRPLVEVWICNANSSTHGRLPSSFVEGLRTVLRRFNREMERLRAVHEQQLWASRPDYATEVRLKALERMDVWSEVVDHGVAFQRGLREKEAWIALAKERKSKRNWGLAVLRDSARTAAAADDQYIGLWINGASEEVYLSYLLARVPCFVVHKFPMANYTPTAVKPHPPTYSNFVDGSLEPLKPHSCGLDGRAAEVRTSRRANVPRSSSMYCSTIEAPAPLPRIAPNRPIPQSAGSTESSTSSRPLSPPSGPSQRSTARPIAHGTAKPPESRSESTRAPPPSAPRATGLSSPASSVPASKSNKYAASEIQRRRVDEARVEWVVPPPIARASKKSDGRFELAEYNDESAWILRGSKAQVDCSSTWYDREFGRCLHFGRYSAEEGVLDDDVFGAPVPRLPFFAIDGQTARPQKASSWMYRTRSPARGDEGRQARTPPPKRLPWAPGCGPSTREGSGQSSKGKGKDVKFDDSDDSDEGMDLADVVAAPVATNVVVIESLDDMFSAVAFEAIARDALYRSGARPIAIDFEEETAFTTDRWLRSDEMEEVEENTPPLENQDLSARPDSSNEDSRAQLTVAISTELANLSVDPEVLGTFLATVGVPRHLLVPCSSSPSPPPEVRVSFPGFSHLTVVPTSQSPPLLPEEHVMPTDSRPLPTAPRAMMLPLSDRLTDPPGPRPLHRIPLLDRLREPNMPLEQRLSNPPLATRIGNPPLRDRVDPAPPSDVSHKRYHDELDEAPSPPDEPEPKKKKKKRGLRSGKDQQKRRKSKAARKGRTAGQDEGAQGDAIVIDPPISQPLASTSRVQLEDLEDGEISDSAFWKDEYERDSA